MRNVLRFVALMLQVSIFLVCGLSCVAHPHTTAEYVERTKFLLTLQQVGVALDKLSLVFCIRVAGIVLCCSTLFVLLGLYRRFFAFILALMYISGTFLAQINFKSAAELSADEKIEILKGVSIAGGLLFVSFSGRHSRFDKARDRRARKRQ